MAITLQPIEKEQVTFTIRGTSPLIQHKWSEKAKREMREKHAGKKMAFSWSVEITCEIDSKLLTIDDLVNLVNRAGFGVGIGEWRPEKSGEYGRFEVDSDKPVNVVDC